MDVPNTLMPIDAEVQSTLDVLQRRVASLVLEQQNPLFNYQVAGGAGIEQNKIGPNLNGATIRITGNLTLNDDIADLYAFLSSFALDAGAVVYSTASAWTVSAAGTANQVLVSGGTGAPVWRATLPASATAVVVTGTLTVTGVSDFNAGTTAGTPGIAFTGDLNTGLGWVSADIFRFIAGGSERGRVNGTGTVTTPLWRLSGDGAVNWIFWLTALPNPSFPQLFITQHATPGSITGCLTALVYDSDNVAIGFDTGTQGGWIARDGSIAVLYKTAAEFRIYGSTGNTPGGAATLTLRWAMALGTGIITQTGALVITSTTDATSINTGSIITDGGVGIEKALWVGGLANIAGAVTLQSTLTVNNNVSVF